ncbi:unnamed protein product [Rhodiola kirilowii]
MIEGIRSSRVGWTRNFRQRMIEGWNRNEPAVYSFINYRLYFKLIFCFFKFDDTIIG